MALHLPDWSWYRDANPISTIPLDNDLATAPSGPVIYYARSECLTYTFRASCHSAHLSWAQVPAFTGSSVLGQDFILVLN